MLALVLAAINLRPGITSFAPLIERIAEELALSRGLISLTTALPVLCMGLLAPLAPRLAVRFGLSPLAALRAVTRDPAEMMGIADKVGMLAPERHADIVVWSGEPLEIASRVEKIWVGGSAKNLSADNGGAATWQQK